MRIKCRPGVIIFVVLTIHLFTACLNGGVQAETAVQIFINDRQVVSDVSPIIVNNRTLVPLRAVSEGLGARVEWQDAERRVLIYRRSGAAASVFEPVPIMGESVAGAENLRSLLKQNNPLAPDLVDLYLKIGREYGVRGDIAFCQAAKETGWWKFRGSVKADQNNYCGLGASGNPATGQEDLRGADPTRVGYVAGRYGASFTTPADGVEAHIQHLYAYACKNPIPAGKILVDPRFVLVKRGAAAFWTDLDGRWAVPGTGYGESILNDYYRKAVPAESGSMTAGAGGLASRDSQTIRIYVDGRELQPDVSPVIVKNRVMVPLRAVSEGLGASVEWRAGTRQVIIKKDDL